MLGSIRRTLRRLKQSTSGNAAMLVALGMPALMGTSGLAVDVAQWYMWERELQFSVDQAALAGAWARSSNTTQGTYVTRALQEFDANLATTDGATSTPSVTLGDYNDGSDNAVLVAASATKSLPFTSFITGRSTTIAVSAKATFTMSSTYNACILSVNPVENRSVIFGNAITGSSDCGVGALSTGDQAIVETGDSEVALGDIISAGGVEETFSNNGTIHENVTGLSDPYGDLTPPSTSAKPSLPQTYSCPAAEDGTTTWTADRSVKTATTYLYKRGNPVSSATPITRTPTDPGYMAPTDPTDGPTLTTFTAVPTAGETIVYPDAPVYTHVAGTGTNRIWRAPQVTTTTTIFNPVLGPFFSGTSDGIARPAPGVYTDIDIQCDTVFDSGVYFISGSIDFGNNHSVTGSDVLFVMTGTAGDIRINSNSIVSISGISAATLKRDYNVSDSDAAKMDTMLFFDKNNDSDFDVNGNATLDLSGILYMPSREVQINGNMSSGTRCIMLVSDTFHITGSANLTNFCPTSPAGSPQLGERPASVRLVA